LEIVLLVEYLKKYILPFGESEALDVLKSRDVFKRVVGSHP
jgi:hypothetical protein